MNSLAKFLRKSKYIININQIIFLDLSKFIL